MSKISSLDKKGFADINGKIQTQTIIIEDETCQRNVKFTPIIKEINSLSDYMGLLKEIHTQNENRLNSKGIKCGSYFFYRGQNNIEFSPRSSWLFPYWSPSALKYLAPQPHHCRSCCVPAHLSFPGHS